MLGIGTLTARLLAAAMVWIGGALVAGGFLLAALFEAHVERSFDRRLETLLEALVAVTDADSGAKGGIRVTGPQGDPRFNQPYSGLYWQINQGRKIRLASRSLWDKTLVLEELPAAASAEGNPVRRYLAAGPRAQRLRVIERDITLDEAGPVLRYVVAGDLAQVDAEFRPFMVTLIWSLSVLGIGLFAAVLIQVHVGLRPLDRLREALGRVRAGRAERLEGDFPSEVRPLVDEANQLIAHIDEVVARARTHVGNLAHALKTPIAVLMNEARGEDPLAIKMRRQGAIMQDQIHHHLDRAQIAAQTNVIGALTPVAPVIEGILRVMRKVHEARAITIEDDVAPDLRFRGEKQDLEEIVGNLVDNACKWAANRVVIRARSDAKAGESRLHLTIDDDGPGLPGKSRERALRRGARLDETKPGSGLGLSIVFELVELYGGTIRLEDAVAGGLSAQVFLPAIEKDDA